MSKGKYSAILNIRAQLPHNIFEKGKYIEPNIGLWSLQIEKEVFS